MKKLWLGAPLSALLGVVMAMPAIGADIPKGDHYVCYPIKGVAFKAREVSFKDQFGTWKVTIVRPVQLCAPASKQIVVAKPEPVINDKLHMVCYEIKQDGKKTPLVQTTDQFGSLKFQGYPATTVCLPAGKSLLKQ
jgi:hypothetical protein